MELTQVIFPYPAASYSISTPNRRLIWIKRSKEPHPKKVLSTEKGSIVGYLSSVGNADSERNFKDFIPCYWIESQVYLSKKILIFFHANAEDIG